MERAMAVILAVGSWVLDEAIQVLAPLQLVFSRRVFVANRITVCGQCAHEHLRELSPRNWKIFLPFIRHSFLLGDCMSLPLIPVMHHVTEKKLLPKQKT